MRVLLAPDCFTGTLTAREAAEAMASGWAQGAPHDTLVHLPLADGGPGFVATLHAALGGGLVPVTVEGPWREATPAVVLVVGTVAYVEAAQAVGLDLVPAHRRDPSATTSAGVGQLIRAALDLGARRIVVGLGGSSTNDAGAGMLAALAESAGGLPGAGLLRAGGGALSRVQPADLAGLAQLRDGLAGVDLVVAADVDVPLLGLHGASAGFAAQKGASPQQAQELERALGHFAEVAARAVADGGPRRDLLASGGAAPGAAGQLARDLARRPGSGAAGGLGFGLTLLGARVLPGAQVVTDAVGLAEEVAGADLVVTGEGCLDWQSLHGKVVAAVAQEGLRHGVPVVAVAGQVLIGRREWAAAGIAGAYAVAEQPDAVAAAMAEPARTLAARVARVARTWSR